jgi:hypothetical protein
MALSSTSGAIQALLIAIGSGQIINQSAFASVLKNFPRDTQAGITAKASGTQTTAFPLIYGFNQIATVGSANDSVGLPPAVAGSWVFVANDASANAAAIYGALVNPLTGVGDTIDAVATATGNTIAAAKRALFICLVTGAWISMAGAKVT